MDNATPQVICIGSMGKDIFFPIATNAHHEDVMMHTGQQFCFAYGSKVHIEDRFSAPGGCACNVSTGLSRLDISVAALGTIGGDADGAWITNMLSREGIMHAGVHIITDAKTDLSVILVDDALGERTILVNRDVGEKLHLTKDDLNGYHWCFVGSLYGERIGENMQLLHESIVNDNMMLAYNPGGHNIDENEDVVLDLVHHARVVFLNKTEAQRIVSKFDLSYTRDRAMDDHVTLITLICTHMRASDGIVVLTDGRHGAWVGNDTVVLHTDTIDKAVHDATGAGDAFASGFLGAMLHNKTLMECVQWGSANADSVIDHYGAQHGLLAQADMQDRIKRFSVTRIK